MDAAGREASTGKARCLSDHWTEMISEPTSEAADTTGELKKTLSSELEDSCFRVDFQSNENMIHSKSTELLQSSDSLKDMQIIMDLTNAAISRNAPARETRKRAAKSKALHAMVLTQLQEFYNDVQKQTNFRYIESTWSFNRDLYLQKCVWEAKYDSVCSINNFTVPISSTDSLYSGYNDHIIDACSRIMKIRSISMLTSGYFIFLDCSQTNGIMMMQYNAAVSCVLQEKIGHGIDHPQGIFAPLNFRGRYLLIFMDMSDFSDLKIIVMDSFDDKDVYQEIIREFIVFVHRVFPRDYSWSSKFYTAKHKLSAKDGDVFTCVAMDLLWQKVKIQDIYKHTTKENIDTARAFIASFLTDLRFHGP
jgi:hypothetical protein